MTKRTADAKTSPSKKAKSEQHSYGWKEVNADLEAGNYIGNYGGHHGVYQAVAEALAGKDLNAHQCMRGEDEFLVKELAELLQQPQIQVRLRAN
jgi:hypothetical protein